MYLLLILVGLCNQNKTNLYCSLFDSLILSNQPTKHLYLSVKIMRSLNSDNYCWETLWRLWSYPQFAEIWTLIHLEMGTSSFWPMRTQCQLFQSRHTVSSCFKKYIELLDWINDLCIFSARSVSTLLVLVLIERDANPY